MKNNLLLLFATFYLFSGLATAESTTATKSISAVTFVKQTLSKHVIYLEYPNSNDVHALQFDIDRNSKPDNPSGKIYAYFLKNGFGKSSNRKIRPFKYGSWFISYPTKNPDKKMLCVKDSKYRSCFSLQHSPDTNRIEFIKDWHSGVKNKKYLPWNQKPLGIEYGFYSKTAPIGKLNIKSKYLASKQRDEMWLGLAKALSNRPKSNNNTHSPTKDCYSETCSGSSRPWSAVPTR